MESKKTFKDTQVLDFAPLRSCPWQNAVLIFFVLLLCFIAGTSVFKRTGIYYDSVIRVTPVVPLLVPGTEKPYDYPLSISLFGKEIPLVLKSYVGNRSLSYLPAFKLFGLNVTTYLRWKDACRYFSGLIVFLVLFFVYGLGPAVLFFLLALPDALGSFPWLAHAVLFGLYIFGVKRNAPLCYFVLPFCCMAWIAFLGVKPSFILPAYAVHFACFLFSQERLSLGKRVVSFGGLCFFILLGALPLIYYNLTEGQLLEQLYYSITDVSKYNEMPIDGGRLPDYSKTFTKKIRLIRKVLDHPSDDAPLPPVSPSHFGFLLTLALVFFLPFAGQRLLHLRKEPWRSLVKGLGSSLSFLVLLIILSQLFFVFFIPDAHGVHHVVPVLPYLKIAFLLMVFAAFFHARTSKSFFIRVLGASIPLALAVVAIICLWQTYLQTRRNLSLNARGYYNPAIHHLIERVDTWGDKQLAYVHWGIDKQLYMFSPRHPVGMLLFHGDKAFLRWYLGEKVRKDPDGHLIIAYSEEFIEEELRYRYVLGDKVPQQDIVKQRKDFLAIAAEIGADLRYFDLVTDSRGKPVFEVYQLRFEERRAAPTAKE